MRPVQYLFLSILLKSLGLTPCSQVLRSLRNHPYVDGRVECKEDLNASRALLVLEHNIKKEWCECPVQSGRGSSVAPLRQL